MSKLDLMDKKAVFIIDGCGYDFIIKEFTHLKHFKASVIKKINGCLSYPYEPKYLKKTIREVPNTEGNNVMPIGMMDKILTNKHLNSKEKITVSDDISEANSFKSKEEAIEFIKEYIKQLKEEHLQSLVIEHPITKADLL